MKIRFALLSLFFAATALAASAPAPPAFQVDLVPVDSSQLPALHSYSIGVGSNGQWLVAGGRTNGLHLFVASSNGGRTAPPNAFPPPNANTNLWVIDPVKRQAWSSPLSALPQSVADALGANNAEYYASNGYLYVIGGYGWNSKTQQMTTFPTLTAINIDAAIQAIVNKQSPASSIQQTSTYYDCIAYGQNQYNSCFATQTAGCQPGPNWQTCQNAAIATCVGQQATAVNTCATNVQAGKTSGIPTNTGYYAKVTGGGMEHIGNTFFLVFGQDFEGLYSVDEGDYGKWPVNQVYTERVVSLAINASPLSAAVLNQLQQNQSDPMRQFHRRDLNVVPALAADGTTARIAVLGGVFVPGQDAAYRQPILIDSTSPAAIVPTIETFQQSMSQYECGVVPLFNRAGGSSALTYISIGGISLYYVDAKTGKLKVDSGLPFISALSALTLLPDNTWSEYYRVAPIAINNVPALVGTDAKFVRNPQVAASANGVIYLDTIAQKTLVGWMYGGIQAQSPNPGASNSGTAATSQLFEVWIDPTPPGGTYWATTANAPQITIAPNADTAKVQH